MTEREQRNRERLDFLLTATPAVLYAFDVEPPHRVTFVTDAIERQLGYTPDEWLADPRFWQACIHPEDAAPMRARLAILSDRTAAFDYRLRHKSGEYRWVHEELRLARRADGTPLEVLGCLVDVTEYRETLRELSDSRARYASLFDNANDIIFTTDLDLRFTSLNAAGEALTGYRREEALGIRVDDVLLPGDRERVRALLREADEGVTAHRLDIEVVTKAGTRLQLEVQAGPVVRDGRRVGVQAIARDVSERRSLERQFMQAQKMEAVGRLAGGVAHDFNNLLTVITGYAEMIVQEPAVPSVTEQAADILRAARRAADLTRQLLAFSRRQILAPRVIDLTQIVGGMERMLARLIGEDIELRLAAGAGPVVTMADPGQVEQVIMNLVVNARDAMPRGGRVVIETALADLDDEYVAQHPGSMPGRYAMLAVSDTGCGMDEITASRIFEPFFTTKEEGKGTGLGLSTVYGIVKQSKGNVWVYSEPGIGTTFKVYLPVCDACPRPEPARPGGAIADAGTERVLIVEDDPGVRQFVALALTARGYRVSTAASASEAEALVSQHGWRGDLLVTDVVMPNAGGRMVADALAAWLPDLKVLYMSGYTNEAIVNHGVLDPSVNFLHKPFTAAELRAKVRDVLSR